MTGCRSLPSTVMNQWSDTTDAVGEWDLDDRPSVVPAGGGMLRQVLDQVIELRDGAAADRAALAHAITASFATFDTQLGELRAALEVASQRSQTSDEAARLRTDEHVNAVASDVAALRADVDGVAKTMLDATTLIVTELRQLRAALLGPNG